MMLRQMGLRLGEVDAEAMNGTDSAANELSRRGSWRGRRKPALVARRAARWSAAETRLTRRTLLYRSYGSASLYVLGNSSSRGSNDGAPFRRASRFGVSSGGVGLEKLLMSIGAETDVDAKASCVSLRFS